MTMMMMTHIEEESRSFLFLLLLLLQKSIIEMCLLYKKIFPKEGRNEGKEY
jgi:hypothetical protein